MWTYNGLPQDGNKYTQASVQIITKKLRKSNSQLLDSLAQPKTPRRKVDTSEPRRKRQSVSPVNSHQIELKLRSQKQRLSKLRTGALPCATPDRKSEIHQNLTANDLLSIVRRSADKLADHVVDKVPGPPVRHRFIDSSREFIKNKSKTKIKI